MDKVVLVTGGAGFIGSHIARSLIADGYEVDIVDNVSTGALENIPAEAEFFKLDLRFAESPESLPKKQYAAILHLAGQSSGEKSFEDPVYDFDANARSTALLSNWALANGIPAFIYASSMGVYGQPASHPVSENVRPEPISFYGASKYSAEQVLRVASLQGLRTVSFRMFSVYGPGQNLDDMKQGIVSIFLAQLFRERSIMIKGSLSRVRDFIHIDDVARAWKLALQSPVSGIFNLAGGKGVTLKDMIAKLIQACGLDSTTPIRQVEGTPGDQFAVSADISALRQVLDWCPRISLDEGIESMVAWARSTGRY
jgi:UDP-glucose 4-epimerase